MGTRSQGRPSPRPPGRGRIEACPGRIFHSSTGASPRPPGRGRIEACDMDCPQLRATTSPRPPGRGRIEALPSPGSAAADPGATEELQCGHDPEAVERSSPAIGDNPCRKLQCGHDPEAVERGGGGVEVRPGHASMRPRPGGRGEGRPLLRVPIGKQRLQCGHDPEAVERASPP